MCGVWCVFVCCAANAIFHVQPIRGGHFQEHPACRVTVSLDGSSLEFLTHFGICQPGLRKSLRFLGTASDARSLKMGEQPLITVRVLVSALVGRASPNTLYDLTLGKKLTLPMNGYDCKFLFLKKNILIFIF